MDRGGLLHRYNRWRSRAVDVLAWGNKALDRAEAFLKSFEREQPPANVIPMPERPVGPDGYDPMWDDLRGGMYYDRQGRPMNLRQWAEGYEDKRVAESTVITKGGLRVWVSTVWLGIDHGFGFSGVPIIFETMAFPQESDGFKPTDFDMNRYATERGALAGHQEMVGRFAQDWWLDLGGRA